MATYYLDYEGGNDASDGLSYANRWKTFDSGATAARIGPGDTIRIMASPDPTSLGITATWTNNSPTVTLASSLNTLIDNCDVAWTASPNVTCTANTTQYRTSTGSASHSIAGAFTTGLAAYKALGGAQDYSAFQGITFWIQASAVVAASTLSLRLCSDAAGVTTVDTLAIPALPVAGQWAPIYVDKGSALGASIQSIALYCDADPGTVVILLDNISTVKAVGADNLNLTSLIGKNTGSEQFWALRSINGTTLTLDAAPNMTASSTPPGYVGTTESVTTYQRTTIKTTMTPLNAHLVQDAGTSGNLITYSGGWNRTDMSTQTGVTYFDGQCGTGNGIDFNSKNFISLDKCYVVRYGVGINVTGSDCVVGTVGAVACGSTGVNFHSFSNRSTSTAVNVVQGNSAGFVSNSNAVSHTSVTIHGSNMGGPQACQLYGYGIRVGTLTIKNVGGIALSLGTAFSTNINISEFVCDKAANGIAQTAQLITDVYMRSVSISNVSGIAINLLAGRNVALGDVTLTSNGTGISVSAVALQRLVIGKLTTSGNTTVISSGVFLSDLIINNSSFAEGSPLSFTGSDYTSGRVTFLNYNGTIGDHRVYYGSGSNGGTVFADSTTRHTSQGRSWKFNVLNTTYITAYTPITLPVARIAVNANKQVTASIWTRRSSTSMVGTFRCRGGQLPGVANDVTASSSGAINTWEQLTLIFTPTVAGVLDLDFSAYGVTSQDLFIHDFTVTQAV